VDRNRSNNARRGKHPAIKRRIKVMTEWVLAETCDMNMDDEDTGNEAEQGH
jgi:hypothetical protein